jgi:16S rRNA processing protein RimM
VSSEGNRPEQGEWVTVARLVRARGNRGELAALDLTSRPGRLESLRRVWLFGPGTPYEVEEVWRHEGKPVFKFRGIDTIGDAEPLAGAEVRVPLEERAPLDQGEYYQSDLVGCEVFEPGGRRLGAVTEFHEYGGTPLLELEDGLLIPFARAIGIEIDVAGRRIVAGVPEGLKDLNRP